MSVYVIASVSLFVTIFVSGSIPLLYRWKQHHFDIFLCFGAGVLLSAAFLHMLPTAIESSGEQTGLFVLGGFLLLFFAEQFTMTHACSEEACPNHKVGLSALLGLSIHSIITGIALGVSFLGVSLLDGASHSVVYAMLFAVLIHKIPESLTLAAMLLASAWKRRTSFIAILVFALMSPLGIWLSRYYSGNALGAALGVSTGTFLYIASSDLLPHLHKKEAHRWWNLTAFTVGLLLLAFQRHSH